MRVLAAALTLVSLVGCATLSRDSFDQRFGPADPTRYDQPLAPAAGGVSYRADVQPILERRCVVCHGCYDAPCQLKLGAWEGIARGASSDNVYDTARLREADADAPVRRRAAAVAVARQGLLPGAERALAHARGQPGRQRAVPHAGAEAAASAAGRPGAGRGLRFLARPRDSPARASSSSTPIERKSPLAGMPYGLPGLNARELDTVTRWLAAGAPYEGDLPLSAVQRQQVQAWEAFLNGASNKERLMSRYLYEHLFLGHLHFDADATHRAVPAGALEHAAGQPVQTDRHAPALRRPRRRRASTTGWCPSAKTLLAKTHMPYALSPARMDKYRALVPGACEVQVNALPSYEVDVAANPFVTFRELPVESRYRFLLDEAEFFIMNFIKGPVCRGQMAVDVIEDHFWVFFVEPGRRHRASEGAGAAARRPSKLRLPAETGSNAGLLGPWREDGAPGARVSCRTKSAVAAARRFGSGRQKLDLSLIWDGDGRNPNAALTVFRHFDSASVVKGLVGEPPKTAWVIGYPLFERIYYLLVAGYDVYGNVGHQLNSRLYMDFMRMEGEFNFLLLLPQARREATARTGTAAPPTRPRTTSTASNAARRRKRHPLPQQRPAARALRPAAPAAGAGAGHALRPGRAWPTRGCAPTLQSLASVQGASLSLAARDGGAAGRRAAAARRVLQPAARHRACQRRAPGAREGQPAARREHA